MECKKCGGKCKPSKVLNNTLISLDDFGNDSGLRGTTQSRVGTAKLIDCLKCEDCGHSFIPKYEIVAMLENQVVLKTPKGELKLYQVFEL